MAKSNLHAYNKFYFFSRSYNKKTSKLKEWRLLYLQINDDYSNDYETIY